MNVMLLRRKKYTGVRTGVREDCHEKVYDTEFKNEVWYVVECIQLTLLMLVFSFLDYPVRGKKLYCSSAFFMGITSNKVLRLGDTPGERSPCQRRGSQRPKPKKGTVLPAL